MFPTFWEPAFIYLYPSTMGTRLDIYLTEKKLADSRSRAQWMIEQGLVKVNGKTATKPAIPIEEMDEVLVTQQPAYISYGGFKIEKAAKDFHFVFEGKKILDIGASTGGFTDYALKNKALHVTCIDTGRDQLHESLRQNNRVTFFEHTDLRNFDPAQMPEGPPDLILADLSFISIKKVIDDLVRFSHNQTEWLILVKPQFEMEQRMNFKNGIVPPKYHDAILKGIEKDMVEKGYRVKGISPTLADGKSKNIEYFMLLAPHPASFA